ncbi:MAG: carboxypeptidase-like regulatory domain-containing protein, partial [Thermoanaerobaculia bacterium]
MPCVGFALLLALPLAAADLTVEVTRNGFTAPLEIVLAPRVDGMLPKWSARKTIAAEQSAVTFPNLDDGLYLILAKGPQPLQRLSARINLGTAGSTLRLVLPATETAVQVTLAGKPLPRAGITFTHDELRWRMDVETDEHGRFAGPLWEPGRYSATVTRGHSAPHLVEHVTLSAAPLTIDVPDRHVTGRVLTGDGTPVADAQVHLRTETSTLKLNARTRSGPDGRFEFLGALEGLHTLTARAPSYLQSDAARFELHGAGGHSADLVLTRGEPRSVRDIAARDAAIAGATL